MGSYPVLNQSASCVGFVVGSSTYQYVRLRRLLLAALLSSLIENRNNRKCRSAVLPVRKEFAAAQNIFSTEAVSITKALPDEKIFDSPLANPFAQTSQSSYTETESFSIRSFRMETE